MIRMVKLRRMRWTGHVAHMGEKRNACRVLAGEFQGKSCYENLDVDGRIVLKWMLEK
jgi:hypothetical protein